MIILYIFKKKEHHWELNKTNLIFKFGMDEIVLILIEYYKTIF